MMTVVKVGQIVVELLYDRSVIQKQNNEIKLLICDKEDKNVTIVKRRLKYYHEGD